METRVESEKGGVLSAEKTESEDHGEPAGLEEVNPENFKSSSSFKNAVYDHIEEGVPSLMFDLKLEIIWRKANDVELEDYMKEVLKDE